VKILEMGIPTARYAYISYTSKKAIQTNNSTIPLEIHWSVDSCFLRVFQFPSSTFVQIIVRQL